MSPEAVHYYGRLHFYAGRNKYHNVEVKRKLSAKEARALTKLDQGNYDWMKSTHKAGDLTDRFDSIEDLRGFAVRHYKTLVPGAEVLIVGSWGVCDPQECLDGPDDLKLSINNHFMLFERCGGHDGDAKEADFLYKSFQKLLTKHKVK